MPLSIDPRLIRTAAPSPLLPGRARHALLLLCLVLAACRPARSPDAAAADAALARLDVRGRAAQLVAVVVPAAAAASDAAGSAARIRLHRAVVADSVGALVLEAGAAADTAAMLIDSLQHRAAAPLLVVAALERGVGGVLTGATEFPLARAVAALGDAELARRVGTAVGTEAALVGIDVALVGTSPLGLDGEAASLLALDAARERTTMAAYLRALGAQGTLAGLSTFRPPVARPGAVLRWDRARLDAIEIPLLAAARDAHVGAVVLGPAVLPALSGDTLPLPLSRATANGLVRRDLAWQALVLVDVSDSSALARRYGAPEAAVRAVAAGADLLLGVGDAGAMIDALVAAVRGGRIPAARLDEAAKRVLEAKHRAHAARRAPLAERLERLHATRTAELASDAFRQTRLRLSPLYGGPTFPAEWGRTLLVTPLGQGHTLTTDLHRLDPASRSLVLNLTADTALLVRTLEEQFEGAETVVLAEFPVAGASLPLLARRAARRVAPRPRLLHVRFLTDDPAPEPPDGGAVLVWGTGARSQRAASEALARADASLAKPPPRFEWPPARTLVRAAAADVGMAEDALARADAVLSAAVRDSVFPGAALVVGRRGGVVRLRGYGMTSRESDARPVDAERTLYDLASLTKVIATTPAAMALVARGRLELDAPVQRYVPEFSGALKDRVTVRQLLDHTSGLPAGLNLYGTPGSPADALRRVLNVRLATPPGTAANYSDLGMILLAEVVRRVSGEPFDVFAAGAVYQPLGMASTMFLPPLALRDWVAPSELTSEREYLLQGIVHDGSAFRLGGISGNAGLFATAYDVAILAQTMLARGAYGTVRLYSPALVDSFTRIQPGADTRALGWDTPSERSSAGSFFSARAYGHTGYTGTSIWIDPARDLFVVLLTNRTYDHASPARILKVRRDLHDAVARAVTDQPLAKRPGAIEDRPPVRRPAPRRRR